MVVRVSGGDCDHCCVLKVAVCSDCVRYVDETHCACLLFWVLRACSEQAFRFAQVSLVPERFFPLCPRFAVAWVERVCLHPMLQRVVQVRLHRRGLPSQLELIALSDAPIAFLLVAHPGAFVFARFLPFFDFDQQRSFPFPCAVWMAAMKLPCALPVRQVFQPFSQVFWLFF